MLVGVVNAPTRYSPRSNPDRALIRRNTVIDRMRAGGFLTRHQRDSIKALPIVLDYHPISHDEGTGTYFRSMLQIVMTSDRPDRKSFAPGSGRRLGLQGGRRTVGQKSAVRLVSEKYEGERRSIRFVPRRAEDLYDDQCDDAEICREGRMGADGR